MSRLINVSKTCAHTYTSIHYLKYILPQVYTTSVIFSLTVLLGFEPPPPSGKSQVDIGFLRNMGTDPLRINWVQLLLEGGSYDPL